MVPPGPLCPPPFKTKCKVLTFSCIPYWGICLNKRFSHFADKLSARGRGHTQRRWCSTWLWATGRRWWVGDLAASESGALPPIRRRRRSCPPPPAPSRHRWQRPGEPLCLVALCPPPSDPPSSDTPPHTSISYHSSDECTSTLLLMKNVCFAFWGCNILLL